MLTVKVNYNGKKVDGTLVSYNEDMDTYFIDVPINGNFSKECAFPGNDVRSLNPSLKNRGKPLNRW